MILDDIVEKRKLQLEHELKRTDRASMRKSAEVTADSGRSFKCALQGDSLSVIAEVKRASPSKGMICKSFNPVEIAVMYEKSGASAVSCLTEEHYFKGSSVYLSEIRKSIDIPILRKDFIIDEYQIYEARVLGADAILLIAAILDTNTLCGFKALADSLGLDCLFEIHDEAELEKVMIAKPEIVGINNRNLKTFEVSLENTERLAGLISKECIIVSESGIRNGEDAASVRKYGANAILVGETLMRSADVGKEMQRLRGD